MLFPPSKRPRDSKSPSAGGPAKTRRAKAPLEAPALYEYAVKSLAARMRTVRDLKRLLRNRAEVGDAGEAAVEAVVTRLKEMNYLNDTRFAADFARLRQENEKFGQRRVQQDLMRKGVHAELISSTIASAYQDVDEVELARRHIARKRMKPPLDADGKQDAKLVARSVGRLLRAGFSSNAIFKLLKDWGADGPALQALDGAELEAAAGEDADD